MAGVQAGRLSIEIVAEIARLQSDLDKAKRAVNAASSDIAKSARAANDNLAAIGKGAGGGVQQFTRDVKQAIDYMERLERSSTDVATRINAITGVTSGVRRSAADIAAYGAELDRLRASYNPVFAVTQQYLQAVEAIRRAHAVGAISADEMTAAISRERQQTLASIGVLKGRAAAAQEAAAAEREAARQSADYAVQAANLRAQLDPMFAAQQRFNTALDTADTLLKAGVISEREWASAQQLARDALQQHAQAVAGNSQELRQHAVVTESVGEGMTRTTGAGKMMAMQLSQVAQQALAGGSVLQAFALQLPDIAIGMGAAGKEAGAFARFMGGGWGIAIATATAVLIPLIGKLFDTADAADTARGALDALIKKRREEVASRGAEIQGQEDLNKLQEQQVRFEQSIAKIRAGQTSYKSAEDQAKAIARIQGYLRDNSQKQLELQDTLRAEQNRAADENNRNVQTDIANQAALEAATTASARAQAQHTIAIKAANDAWEASGKTQADQITLRNALTAADRKLNEAQDAVRASHDRSGQAAQRHADALERDSDAIAAAIRGAYALAAAYKVSDAAAMEAAATAKAEGEAIRKRGDIAAYVALELRRAVADQTANTAKAASDLNAQAKAQETVNASVQAGTLQAADAGKALSDLAQQREILAAISAAANNHDAEGMRKAQQALDDLTAAQIRNHKAATAADDIQRAAQLKDDALAIQNEITLTQALGEAQEAARKGLSGNALADQMAAIGVEAEKTRIRLEAETQAALLLRDGLTSAAAATIANAEARVKLIDLQAKFDKEAVAAQRLADNVDAISGALGNVSGAAGPLGQLLGALTSNNPTGALLGMGGIGTLVGMMTGGGQQAYRQQGKIIADNVSAVFGIHGPFAKTLGDILQGAATGSLVGSIFFGGSKSSQLGATLGGALGQGLSKTISGAVGKALGSTLGSIAGAAAPVVGALLGGLLGSVFKKTTNGAAIISNSDVTTSGNNAQLQSQMGQTGSSIQDALNKIASTLGGNVGNYNVSIAQRSSGWIHVDGSGAANVGAGNWINSAGSNAVYNGKDMNAAIQAALANAIQDGAVQGINHIQQWLLQNNSNIDAALAQASKVGAVFDELKQRTDPLAYALDALDKQFDDLRQTFTQAGATADEMAQLEQLLALKRKDAMDEDAKRQLDELNKRRELEVRLMEAQGDSAGALALSRQIELSQTDDALKSLMQQIYVAEDARDAATAAQQALDDAAQKFGTLAKNLRDYANSLTGSTDEVGGASYRNSQVEFIKQSALAATGNLDGLGALQGAAQTFLEASKANSTYTQYQRDLGSVLASLNKAASLAESLAANPSTLPSTVPASAAAVPATPTADAATPASDDLLAEVKAMRAEQARLQMQILENGNAANRLLNRWDGDGVPVRTDEDTPLHVEVV